MNDSFGSGPTLIGIVITSRAITGATVAGPLNRMTQLFSSRTLVVSSFLILTIGMATLPFITGPWGGVFSALSYGAAFGITRPLVPVHLFEIVPSDLRTTFFLCQWHGAPNCLNHIAVCCRTVCSLSRVQYTNLRHRSYFSYNGGFSIVWHFTLFGETAGILEKGSIRDSLFWNSQSI